MPGSFAPETMTTKPAPVAEQDAETSELPLKISIPGRSVNPAKLTAMLRSNFGIGAYDIMVSPGRAYTI